MDIKYYKAFDLEGKYIGATSTSYFVRFQKKRRKNGNISLCLATEDGMLKKTGPG